jgi:hypothetical protein
MEMTDQQPSEDDIKQFLLAVTNERFIYLKYLKFRGYAVDERELEELEKRLFTEDRPGESDGDFIGESSVAELQQQLAFVDLYTEDSSSAIKALLHRLGHIKVRMWPEHNHQRAHFHIEYKREYSASYSVDTLERLAGEMPRRYEDPVLEWASGHQQFLNAAWERLNNGDDRRPLVIERDEA